MVPAFNCAPDLAFLPNVRQDPRRARSLFPAAWARCTPAGHHHKGWGLASRHPANPGAAPSNTTQLPSCPPGRCRHHGATAGSPSPLGHPRDSPAQQSQCPPPPWAAVTSGQRRASSEGLPAKGFQLRQLQLCQQRGSGVHGLSASGLSLRKKPCFDLGN